MANPRLLLPRILCVAAAAAFYACLPAPVSAIRGCNLDSQCCNSYEYCVSCCLNPSRTKEADVLKLKVAKPVTAGTYTNIFDFCMGRCRHSSASVVHENAYLSDFHHCFLVQQNSSGTNYILTSWLSYHIL
uniref:SREBP regulating gene protein n=1 Tax=Aegilops tauschii TaxID=37682 RepID=M8BBK7_AEGTA